MDGVGMYYEVRITENRKMKREKISSLSELISYLKSIDMNDIIGVYEVNPQTLTSKQIPCYVEGDLVIIGKPM